MLRDAESVQEDHERAEEEAANPLPEAEDKKEAEVADQHRPKAVRQKLAGDQHPHQKAGRQGGAKSRPRVMDDKQGDQFQPAA